MIDIVERLEFDATRCEMQFSKGVAGNITEAAAEIERLRAKCEKMRNALEPFSDLAGKLENAPNLIGLLVEEDFRLAAEAYHDEQSAIGTSKSDVGG